MRSFLRIHWWLLCWLYRKVMATRKSLQGGPIATSQRVSSDSSSTTFTCCFPQHQGEVDRCDMQQCRFTQPRDSPLPPLSNSQVKEVVQLHYHERCRKSWLNSSFWIPQAQGLCRVPPWMHSPTGAVGPKRLFSPGPHRIPTAHPSRINLRNRCPGKTDVSSFWWSMEIPVFTP